MQAGRVAQSDRGVFAISCTDSILKLVEKSSSGTSDASADARAQQPVSSRLVRLKNIE